MPPQLKFASAGLALEITIHVASSINLHVAVVPYLILFLHNVKLSKDPVHSPALQIPVANTPSTYSRSCYYSSIGRHHNNYTNKILLSPNLQCYTANIISRYFSHAINSVGCSHE